jgi:hypothetical protein
VRCAFDYAIVRVVPRVEREEFVNAGAIVLCEERGFLAASIELDEARLLALAPDVDLATTRAHLDAIPWICQGGPDAGAIGQLTLRERWHWLVAPRSTIIQTSPAHVGLDDDPVRALARLVETMVRTPRGRSRGARTAPMKASVEEAVVGELRELEAWFLTPEARTSVEAIDRATADDFLEIGKSGRLYDKAHAVTTLLAPPSAAAPVGYTTLDFQARALAPDLVQVFYRLLADMGDGAEPRQSLRTSIWAKRDGRWQILFHQGTRREE